MSYPRKSILAKLRGRQSKIVYIATCDPKGTDLVHGQHPNGTRL